MSLIRGSRVGVAWGSSQGFNAERKWWDRRAAGARPHRLGPSPPMRLWRGINACPRHGMSVARGLARSAGLRMRGASHRVTWADANFVWASTEGTGSTPVLSRGRERAWSGPQRGTPQPTFKLGGTCGVLPQVPVFRRNGAGGNRTPVPEQPAWRLYACVSPFVLDLGTAASGVPFGQYPRKFLAGDPRGSRVSAKPDASLASLSGVKSQRAALIRLPERSCY